MARWSDQRRTQKFTSDHQISHAPITNSGAERRTTERRFASVSQIALLTPVPLQHLLDGRDVCEREGRVAFGSQAWQVFRELDREAGPGTRVLIYASHAGVPRRQRVSWTASYLRYVESKGGAHPERARVRPPSTIADGEDAAGYWAGFYEVADLQPLGDDEQVAIRDLADRRGRRYGRDFPPEGPIIITEL